MNWLKRRCWALLLAAAVVGVALHAPLARGLAGLLVVDQPLPPAATHVLLAGGDRQFDRAAELLTSGRCRAVLVQAGPPDRLAYVGILPTWPEVCRRELARRGVPAERLVVQEIDGRRSWDGARELGRWLTEHPESQLIVLADRFGSGRLDYVYRQTLTDGQRQRLAIRGLPDRRYDERNWWRSRTGIKALLGGLLDRCLTRLRGEELRPSYDPDPEAYERRLFPCE